MWIDAKPRNGRNETLFIFKFTSMDDLNVFIKMLQLYASTSTDPGSKQYMSQFAESIQKRCDDKFADNRAKLSATVFADEMATFTDCLNRICFEYEMARIKAFATNQFVPSEPTKEVDDTEFLKKESQYLDQIRTLTDALVIERNNMKQRIDYDMGIKSMIYNNQTAFITEQGQTAPTYVVMSMDQYNALVNNYKK